MFVAISALEAATLSLAENFVVANSDPLDEGSFLWGTGSNQIIVSMSDDDKCMTVTLADGGAIKDDAPKSMLTLLSLMGYDPNKMRLITKAFDSESEPICIAGIIAGKLPNPRVALSNLSPSGKFLVAPMFNNVAQDIGQQRPFDINVKSVAMQN